ncbi:NAD(P)/FAD-dependent oxidoreductase [Rhizobium rhizogenes]|uniref:NAD(P)/FAD-dependent oxidoreductase n=1 Tax=Rhizobium rhizogenes TaxID=359 RepID=UPI001573D293|nr:FAD-dependent oxidoreductase [Rhizobium rhizogenes]NTF83953.1 FAD-dependent oxidoreductase [Rhizobium rhizogenes]
MTDVLILGASHSGIAAATALRSLGFDGSMAILTQETVEPYHKPPLSKEALSSGQYSPAPLRPAAFYETNRIDLRQGVTISALDLNSKVLQAKNGRQFGYENLILACGAEPRRLTSDTDPEGLALYLRTHNDLVRLKNRLSSARSVVIIGGGLIGLEVAAMAVAKGLRTVLIEPAERLMMRAVSRCVSGYLLDRHMAAGLDARLGISVTEIRRSDNNASDCVSLSDGSILEADLTIAAIGIVPNDELARSAGLPVDTGILASEHGVTGVPSVYAIGDCAAWLDPLSGRYVRSEAVNPAQDQAKIVAALIAGVPAPSPGIPRLWSHQGRLKIQMAGDVNGATDEAVLNAPESGAFSVLGFADDRMISVQSVNAQRQFLKLHELIGVDREAVATALDVEFPPPRH